jgi:hypothetical protein
MKILLLFISTLLLTTSLHAQTSAFTYQGKLTDNGSPANGQYDLRFEVFDTDLSTTPVAPAQTIEDVQVTGGLFKVELSFDFPPFTSIAANWVEVSVRPGSSTGAFTTLTPRQHLTSTPYAMQSAFSTFSTLATNATNAVNATTAENVTGVVQIANGGTGSSTKNFVDLTTNQTIAGNKTFSGTLSGQTVNATFEYRLRGQQFINAVGSNLILGLETGLPNVGIANTYVGYRSGSSGTSNAGNNAFFGANSGLLNSNGNGNSFFGSSSGEQNTFGGFNSFFGNNAGAANASGNRNTFIGVTAGRDNLNGSDNTFVGSGAGQANQSGESNSFFGSTAGIANTSGTFNTAIGAGANFGSGALTNATAIGAGALVTSSNTVTLGRPADTVQIPGNLNVGGSIIPAIIPTGAVMFFELAACPAGWSELESARGRYLVGLPAGGTLGATQGTALSNLEDRPTGQHGHPLNPSSHTHETHGHAANVTINTPGGAISSTVAGIGLSLFQTGPAFLSVGNAGNVAGTNAPYLQLLVCKKN